MANNMVAIVGRPNVGKSTLFNRLVGQRKAIVDDFSGVTRDRQYGEADWNGRSFNVIDTGGFVANSDDIFEKAIAEQVLIALDEADVIVFVVDCMTGITALDQNFANLLFRTNKPVILAVNKVDNSARNLDAMEFYGLGFSEVVNISSITGSGTGELLDLAVSHFSDAPHNEMEEGIPKLAILGQPNVGKSSLLNALLGENRNIVSDVPGTTRDTIHTHYNKYNKSFYLIDTAGLRKKSKVHEDLEFYSVIRAVRALEESDVCILMVDATKGVTSQDINIFSMAERKGKGIVILVNKWDLIEDKETNTAKNIEEEIKKKLAPFTDVPIIFTSVLEKNRIHKALEEALAVYERRSQRIKTSDLNEWLEPTINKYHPPIVRGAAIKINYVMQLPTVVPSFAFYANHPDSIKDSYKNYLENQLRIKYNFSGVPLRLYFRKK